MRQTLAMLGVVAVMAMSGCSDTTDGQAEPDQPTAPTSAPGLTSTAADSADLACAVMHEVPEGGFDIADKAAMLRLAAAYESAELAAIQDPAYETLADSFKQARNAVQTQFSGSKPEVVELISSARAQCPDGGGAPTETAQASAQLACDVLQEVPADRLDLEDEAGYWRASLAFAFSELAQAQDASFADLATSFMELRKILLKLDLEGEPYQDAVSGALAECEQI